MYGAIFIYYLFNEIHDDVSTSLEKFIASGILEITVTLFRIPT